MASLNYHRGDELPAWEPDVTLVPAVDSFETGWTFTVTLSAKDQDTVTKTENIAAVSASVIQVQWDEGELDIPEGTWMAQLTGTRTSDGRQFTIDQPLYISPRVLEEGS